MHTPWTHKYKPKTLKDVVGQDKQAEQLKDFITNFQNQKKKAAFLYGPTGSGKTSMVHAIANDVNLELVEVNASDFRTEEQINLKVGNALKQRSLFSEGKIILIDEVDGISGMQDRGGVGAIAKLLDEAKFPIIITGNDPWDSKFSNLRSASLLIEFSQVNITASVLLLKEISKKEGIKADEEDLKALARRSGGDLRATINDFQSLTQDKTLKKEDIETLGERNRTESIIAALIKVLKSTDPNVAKGAFDNLDEDLDECILWLDENLPYEYTKPEDIARAYDVLSKADVFRGRIRRKQHWHFLTYVNDLSTAGISSSKDEKYKNPPAYKRSMRPLKIWQANQKYAKRKQIAQKIASKTHSSTKESIQNIPFIKDIFKNKSMAETISKEFELDKDEIAYLNA